MKEIRVLNCPVHSLSFQEAIGVIEGFIASGRPHQIVPVNAAKLWRMERDARLRQIVESAALIVPEKAIVMASRALGWPVEAHIGGITLLKRLLPVAAARGYRVYFLGARREVLERMIPRLQSEYPDLQIAGWRDGYFAASEEAAVAAEIRASRPDLLFVALGTPKQEYWIARNLAQLGVPAVMGVGGSFDVLSGLKKDAPEWVRALALEWLYRLAQDPRNLWKRYLITIPWFCARVAAARARRVFAQ
jgi:N-acetylglucosaminyldiphosphoundecaprenol N-acetyl-beta-D-mannosaminyltransferase